MCLIMYIQKLQQRNLHVVIIKDPSLGTKEKKYFQEHKNKISEQESLTIVSSVWSKNMNAKQASDIVLLRCFKYVT